MSSLLSNTAILDDIHKYSYTPSCNNSGSLQGYGNTYRYVIMGV